MRSRALAIGLVSLALLACRMSDSSTPYSSSTPATSRPESTAEAKASVTPDTPLNNPSQRLARAADVRRYLRENDIPANVIAVDRTLKIYYERASADYMEAIFETFCRQQNVDGLLASGFETISINADDSFGKGQTKSFPLIDCKKVKSIELPTPRKGKKS